MKKNASVLIIIRVSPTNGFDACALAKIVLDGCGSPVAVPFHWNAATGLFFEPETLDGKKALQLIKRRFTENIDKFLSAGYMGAIPDLLLSREVMTDLSWAVANPLKTGTLDQGAPDGECFLPFHSEYTRNEVTAFCAQTGRLLIKRIISEGKVRGLCTPTGSLPAVEITGPIDKALKAGKTGTPVCFWASVSTPSDAQQTGLTLATLIKALTPLAFGKFSHDFFIGPVCASGEKQSGSVRIRQAAGIRANSIRNQNSSLPPVMKKLLKNHALTPGHIPEDLKNTPEDLYRLTERAPGAHMGGQITLAGNNVNVAFDQGRLSAIGTFRLPELTSTEFCINKKTYVFKPETIYSFEGRRCHGLRSQIHMHSDAFVMDGQIIADWFFSGEDPRLFVSVTIIHPGYLPADKPGPIVPLRLPILDWSEDDPEQVMAESVYPDGSVCKISLANFQGDCMIHGSSFRFKHRTQILDIHFVQQKDQIVETVFLSIRKNKGRFLLTFNPRGTYQSEAPELYSEILEHFTLALLPNPSGKLENPVFAKNVLEEINASVLIKTGRTKEEALLHRKPLHRKK